MAGPALLLLAACSGNGGNGPSGETLYRPAQVVSALGGSRAPEPRLAELERRSALQDERIAGLDRALVALSGELAALRSAQGEAISAAARRDDERDGRILALERQIVAAVRRMSAMSRQLEAMAEEIALIAGEASATRNLVNRAEAQRAETADEGAVASLPAGEAYALHLASYRDRASAVEGWAALSASLGAPLADLEARLDPFDLGEFGGRYLRLVAGPYPDVAPAREVCARLRGAGAFCQVAAFRGESLLP